MYKMLVLDMDGTLLNERQEISERTQEAVRNFALKGGKVVIATGRAYSGVIPYLQALGIDRDGFYTVACAGANIVDNGTSDFIDMKEIPHEVVQRVHDFCVDYDLDMCAYTEDWFLINRENLFSRYDEMANRKPLKVIDYKNLDPKAKVFKINVINESTELKESMLSYFPTFELDDYSIRQKDNFNPDLLLETWRLQDYIGDGYEIVQPLSFCVEVIDRHSHKAEAVKQVQEIYGIKDEEVICIGDSGNDVHMVEHAGLGVAMGNAIDALKEVADLVIGGHDEDGIADFLESIEV